MKVCEKCGVPQKDSNFKCVECGAILPSPLDEETEEKYNAAISEYVSDRAERTDDFYVTAFDRVMIGIDIAGVIVSVLLLLFVSHHSQGDYICFYAALAFALCAIHTAFPKIDWFFEELSIRMHLNYHVGEVFPSDYWFISRKIINVAIPALFVILLLYAFLFGDWF